MKITLISTSTFPSDQGLRTVSSVLKKAGYKVEMIFLVASEDYSIKYSKKTLNQLLELCKDSDLIGISSYASTSIRTIQVIKALKRLNKTLVWGGVHATISPEDCIKYLDIVAIGEGELVMLELASKLENKKDITDIKNLWVRKNNKIYKNPVRSYIEDLDKLPFPDYDIEDHYILDGKIRKFQESDFSGQIFFLTGRGCPHSCTYCSNKALKQVYLHKGRVLRWNSPDYIINDILRIKKKFSSIKVIDLRDDTFFARPLEHFKEFCSKYKKYINLRLKCLADPPSVNNEKLKLMIDAGLTDIIIGIQGEENVNFKIYKRFISNKQILDAAKVINKYKLTVMYDVITCNPYETSSDIVNLIKLLKEIPKPYYLSVNNLVFFTGSELYKKALEDGVIKSLKDSAIHLNYWDRFQHIKLKHKNEYLVLVLNLMRGVVTNKKYGLFPSFVLDFLIKKNTIKFFNRNKYLVYLFGSVVGFFDLIREKILKPFYRSLPTGFKVWYDKVRYRV